MRIFSLSVVIAIVALVQACAHVSIPGCQSGRVNPGADHTQVAFAVGNASTSQMLAGVKVTIVANDGSEAPIRQTDEFGRCTVSKDFLRQHGAQFVIFSREGFFSGALRVSEADKFYDFDEHYIRLAVFGLL